MGTAARAWLWTPAKRVIKAYVNGDLMTREEWVATIDYEAILNVLIERDAYRASGLSMSDVKAAFGAGVGEEKSVRSWAKKKGIPIDSLRNDDADLPEPTWHEGEEKT
jgi:deoxyhypusine synthase